MIDFLHTFYPNSVLIAAGPIKIYWYGFIMAMATLSGLLVSFWMANSHKVKTEIIFDLFFWLVISGIVGARIFYALYNPAHFWQNPLDFLKIWKGGIAFHGALVFGVAVLAWRAKKYKIGFWKLASIIAPGIALGQAIGRWGNYFNQELFGRPTELPWGIPISLASRPEGFEMYTHFHPAFLYESIGNFVIFGILILAYLWLKKKNRLSFANSHFSIIIIYLLLYSLLRLGVEFFRVDPTAGNIFGLRAPQIASLFIIIVCIFLILNKTAKKFDF